MRMIPPFRIPALLLASALAAVPAAAQPTPVTVQASDLQSLQGRLDGFAARLTAEERALWEDVLRRAASRPAQGTEVRVAPVLHIGPGGGCDGDPGSGVVTQRVSRIVQGGRGPSDGIVVQAGRMPAAGGGVVMRGNRPPAPNVAGTPHPTPAGTVAGAPRPAPAGTDSKLEPVPWRAPESLSRRIAELSAGLPEGERGALEWLLTRAALAGQGQPGTPGGLPPGTSISLRQALGIDPLAIGPKQDDPAPPPPAQRWTISF
jgi:hypothetical protein